MNDSKSIPPPPSKEVQTLTQYTQNVFTLEKTNRTNSFNTNMNDSNDVNLNPILTPIDMAHCHAKDT